MSTVQEIEVAIQALPKEQAEEIQNWLLDYLEDQLELSDATKARIEESQRDYAAERYMVRIPENLSSRIF